MANKRRKRRSRGLMGLSAQKTSSLKSTAMQGALTLGAALMGAGLGAAIGRPSFLAGIPVILWGVHKKSMPIIAGGIGMSVSFVPSFVSPPMSGMGALDFKNITEGAKDRVKFYFENFKDKLYLPKSADSISGLGNPVAYFVNPYNRGVGDLDLTELDNIQYQVAEMASPQFHGLNDFESDREF
jgi:hypothetical protein